MLEIENLALTSLMILCLNIPFGYWRAHVRRFRLQWILAIHIPVPLVVFLRIVMNTGWHWITFVLFIGSFFIGQLVGGLLQKRMSIKHLGHTSSCLFVDLYRDISALQ